MTRVNPIEFEVFKNLFLSIAEEMGVTLCRTGFSPNIKERLDYSCAVYDADGRDGRAGRSHARAPGRDAALGARGDGARRMEPGDVVMLNDPFRAARICPTSRWCRRCFVRRERRQPAFYVANRAHHSDVGGMSPGSMPLAREIFQEGLIIPPVRLVRARRDRARRAGAAAGQRAHAGRARRRSDGADRRQSRRRERLREIVAQVRTRAHARLTRRRCRTTPSA